MKTVKQITPLYLQKAAIEEFSSNLRAQGYEVEVEKNLGSLRADILASRDGEKIVYEFKSGPWPKDKTEQVRKLRSYVVHDLGGRFELVWIPPYREIGPRVKGLEQVLAQAIQNNPGPLDELSTHTLVEDVGDIQIDNLEIDPGCVLVEGEGTVYVELNYGSESEQHGSSGLSSSDSFPFEFTVRLDGELRPVEKPEVSIDTSSFHEGAT